MSPTAATSEIVIAARQHQRELIEYFRAGGRHGCCVWARRTGKDYAATFIESEKLFAERCLVWHCFPEFSQARKALWDNITASGERLMDVMFPPDTVESSNDSQMKKVFRNGSVWQAVGADSYDSLIGSNVRHVTYSEFATQNPAARDIIRPILANNGGSELIISTPRGLNHFHDLWQLANKTAGWFATMKTALEAGTMTAEELEIERAEMPDELFRQEYECSFTAANTGSILGRYIEVAEREGRIGDFPHNHDYPVILSSDIGYRDTAAWWFWQALPDGLTLVDYREGFGMDAEEWVDELRKIGDENGYEYETIWLPHDARTKTFATRHPAVETFRHSGIAVIRVVPMAKKADYINAARIVLKTCRLNSGYCVKGLAALRDWHYIYDEERKMRSAEPDHTWSSHASTSFCYGAQMLMPYRRKDKVTERKIAVPAHYAFSLNDLFEDNERENYRW